jgi:DNA-binding transcriptional regulator YdaS (Cro superfamily)
MDKRTKQRLDQPDADPGLRQALMAVGSVTALARKLRLTTTAVRSWERIPAHRLIEVETATGVPREVLRPDLYRPQIKRPV